MTIMHTNVSFQESLISTSAYIDAREQTLYFTTKKGHY